MSQGSQERPNWNHLVGAGLVGALIGSWWVNNRTEEAKRSRAEWEDREEVEGVCEEVGEILDRWEPSGDCEDEADFRLSDERAEIIKILNNGNAKGFPVLRSEATSQREFNPRAYAVFGPKLVATRRPFEDRALESRCLTEEMGQGKLRDDIPINLPVAHKEEALRLRNKLLLFRFRNLGRREPREELVDRTIEPRLNQIFIPLLSIVDDPTARAELKGLARQYHGEMVDERGMDLEAQILEVLGGHLKTGHTWTGQTRP